MCSSGPSNNQKAAQASQTQLANTLNGIATTDQALTQPFWTNQMSNGLPFAPSMNDFSGGQLAQSYAQARGALNRSLAGYGSNGLPSGFKTAAVNQLNAQQARDYDNTVTQNNLLNYQAKQQGAQALNPASYFSGAQSGYGSVMSMPVQPNPLGGILGGAASGLLSMV